MSFESPITYDDAWFAGEDKILHWTITNQDQLTQTSPPAAQDITGYTLSFVLAESEAGAAVVTLTGAIVSGPLGTCNVVVGATDTTNIAPGTYYYQLKRTNAGNARPLAHGSAVLRGKIA